MREPEARGLAAAAPVAPLVREFTSFDALPPDCDRIFATAGGANVCLTRGWFELLARHAPVKCGRLKLLASVPEAADATAILVGRHRDRDRLAFGGRSFTSLDSVYTLLYAPLIGPTTEQGLGGLTPLLGQICGSRPVYDMVRLQALDPTTPAFAALREGLSAQGFAVQTYRHFSNRYEPVAGLAYRDYLAARPGRLRSTITRKARRLERLGRVELAIERDPERMAESWGDYEGVYASSWKRREAQPALMREFARMLAEGGAMRLGLLKLSGTTVAVQIWILWNGVATVYKLAHDRQLDAHSPGTVLTAGMIEHLLDVEHVRELDFGPGDDAWKHAWTSRDRPRWGILAFNPRTLRGHLGIARHIWGRAVKRRLTAMAAGR